MPSCGATCTPDRTGPRGDGTGWRGRAPRSPWPPPLPSSPARRRPVPQLLEDGLGDGRDAGGGVTIDHRDARPRPSIGPADAASGRSVSRDRITPPTRPARTAAVPCSVDMRMIRTKRMGTSLGQRRGRRVPGARRHSPVRSRGRASARDDRRERSRRPGIARRSTTADPHVRTGPICRNQCAG